MGVLRGLGRWVVCLSLISAPAFGTERWERCKGILQVVAPVSVIAALAFGPGWYEATYTKPLADSVAREHRYRLPFNDSAPWLVPYMVKNLGSEDPALRSGAIYTLLKIKPEPRESLWKVLEMSNDPDPGVRVAYLRALELRFNASQFLPEIADAIQDEDQSVRVAGLQLLATVGTEAVSFNRFVLEALKKKDPETRANAAFALGQIAGSRAPYFTDALIQAAKDPDRLVRQEAFKALGRIGKNSETAVVFLGTSLNAETRADMYDAYLGLQRLLGTTVKPAMGNVIKELHHEDERRLFLALWLIEQYGPAAEAAVPDLIELLNDSDPIVQRDSIQALGSIGPKAESALPALQKLSENDEGMRYNANEAIKRIKGEKI